MKYQRVTDAIGFYISNSSCDASCEIYHYGRHFLNIFPCTGNLLLRQISISKSINQLDFFVNRVIYFRNKLPNQIKNSNSIQNFKINLDDFRKNSKKKNLREHFWELSDELLNRIWSM